VVWCPVGKSRAVGLHMSLAKFQLILGVQVGDIWSVKCALLCRYFRLIAVAGWARLYVVQV
jgi:hypothetical protein